VRSVVVDAVISIAAAIGVTVFVAWLVLR